ncbi:hypothetical protein KDL29_13600 [bacterium]|nr:hypothetical protein [bacterium]
MDRLALAAMLALAMQACLLCAACQQVDDDPVVLGVSESGAPVIAGEGMATAKAGSHPVTQAEIDELWNALSEEDRERLETNMNGKHNWDRYSEYSDPEGAWEKLGEENQKQIIESGGQTREEWIHMKVVQGKNYDKAHVAELMQSALNRYKRLVAGPAKVDYGTPVNWQLLEQRNSEGNYDGWNRPAVVPGNYDEDPQEEVAIMYKGLHFLELDGESWNVDGLKLSTILGAIDYDNDGRDELLTTEGVSPGDGYTGLITEGLLKDLDGNKVASMPAESNFNMHLPLVDMDGDGLHEIICIHKPRSEVEERDGLKYVERKDTILTVVEQKGEEVYKTTCSNWDDIMAGDVDGDGRDELLIKRPSQTKTNAFDQLFVGIEQEDQDVLSASGQRDVDPILALVDINGDGRVDLVSSGHVYLSWNSDTVELEFPEGYMLPTAHRQPRPQVVLWQRDGERLLAALLVQGYDDNRSDTLALWDSSGKLVYMEHFGEQVNDILTGEDGRRLYVVTDTRLLSGV